MMTTKKIGDLVKKRRKEIGMDQRELALVSGAGVRFISDLENGKETCQLGKALKVLGNLGLDLTATPKGGALK
jgi:y4mF family transcriptional regulator